MLFLLLRLEVGSFLKGIEKNFILLYYANLFSVRINNVDRVNLYILAFYLPQPTDGWISVRIIDGLRATRKTEII